MKRNKRQISVRLVFIALLVMFLISLVPIIWLGFFAVPQADDFSYGASAYHAFSAGGSFGAIISAATRQVAYSYQNWQGTFSAIFIMALQPAVFGEQFYALTPMLMLAALILGNWFLIYTVCGRFLGFDRYTVGIMSAAVCMLCIQLAPSPIESFFWFNGSLYYTFYHGIFLASIAFSVREAEKPRIWRFLLLCFLACMIGGGNYVTALSYAIVAVSGIVVLAIMKNSGWKRFLFPFAFFLGAFCISVLAPGNGVRQSRIEYTPDAVRAVLSSFQWGIKDSVHWLSLPLLSTFLFLLPFIWRSLPTEGIHFRFPGLVTLYSYCLLSAMYCPPYYAMDGIPDRAVNIIYDTYVLLLLLNCIYWIGWIKQKKQMPKGINDKASLWQTLCTGGICFLCCLLFTRTGMLTSALALHDLRSGEAYGYHEVFTERFRVLHDKSQVDIVFEACPHYPALIGGDYSPNPQNWVNRAVANYYEKNSVRIG